MHERPLNRSRDIGGRSGRCRSDDRPRNGVEMRRDLIERARRGDRDAFGELAAGEIDRLLTIARLVLRDPDLADDAVQEALVRCWRRLPKAGGDQRPSGGCGDVDDRGSHVDGRGRNGDDAGHQAVAGLTERGALEIHDAIAPDGGRVTTARAEGVCVVRLLDQVDDVGLVKHQGRILRMTSITVRLVL